MSKKSSHNAEKERLEEVARNLVDIRHLVSVYLVASQSGARNGQLFGKTFLTKTFFSPQLLNSFTNIQTKIVNLQNPNY